MPKGERDVVYIYRGRAGQTPWDDIRRGIMERLSENAEFEMTVTYSVAGEARRASLHKQGQHDGDCRSLSNSEVSSLARPPTIYDVAREAQVSIKTVSRVLNNCQSVQAAMRTRVLDAVRSMNYQPNSAARDLGARAKSPKGQITRERNFHFDDRVMPDDANGAKIV